MELSEILDPLLLSWLEDGMSDACDEQISLTRRRLLSEKEDRVGVLWREGRRENAREVLLPVLGSPSCSSARVELLELMIVMHMVILSVKVCCR